MMKEIEQSGKTVEEAVAAALKALDAEREEVEVEVLSESGRGILGIFGQTEARVRVTRKSSAGERAVELARQMLDLLGIQAQVALREEDSESAEVEIDGGEDTGLVIGRRGETLAALQHLVALLANKGLSRKKRILLNAGGYLEKREQALRALALRTARKVRASGRSITLDSLSPRERRIIHIALANEPGIFTSSVGTEPNRRVIVSPARPPEDRPPYERPARLPRREYDRPRPEELPEPPQPPDDSDE